MPLPSRPDENGTAAAAAAEAKPPGLTLRTPDLGSQRARLLLAFLVVLVGAFYYGRQTLLTEAFGDTDDAMRMVMVRDLLGGQAFFDHGVQRLQPPLGLEMHWSRLIDGALAGLIRLATPFAGTGAEALVRTLWPLFWLLPASLSAFAIAVRLGGRRAVFPCAVLLLLSPAAFAQFVPGRVDHHDLQIVAVLAALAGAVWLERRRGAGWLAGIATGFLVTVGLEGLILAAAIGVAIALRLAVTGTAAAGARRYALGLGASAALGFLAETDPQRWAVPACDALAINLLAGLLVAASGLALTAEAAARGRLGGRGRLIAVVATGLAAAAVYLGLDPSCLRGPFADVDARLYPIWLDLVKEVAPLAVIWSSAPEMAIALAATPLAALGVGVWCLAAVPGRRDAAWLTALAVLALAVLMMLFQAPKGSPYAALVAAPVAGAAVTQLMRRWRSLLLPTLLATLALSPIAPLAAYRALATPTAAEADEASCNVESAFRTLATLPPGLVLADVDLGPIILAFTPHSVLAAPYHRMPDGILAAYQMLNARPDAAQPLVRARGIDYVALCGDAIAPPYDAMPGNLYGQLKAGDAVDWLEVVPGPGPLRIFRVRP